MTVKVLKLPDRIVGDKKVKIDADDFIKINGPGAFERLINGSENHVEYSLMNLQARFDLEKDEDKVEFLKAAGELISKLSSPVEREIYGGRAAQAAGVSAEAMAQEIAKARKRRISAQKREQERSEMRPELSAQPRERSIRYKNVRSAAAEEGIIRLLIMDPSLIPKCGIESGEFSSPFLGKLYSLIKERGDQGRSVSISGFAGELEAEEMSRLVEITQKPENLALAGQAMNDYIDVIRTEKLRGSGDLMALADRLKKTKGMEDMNSGKKN